MPKPPFLDAIDRRVLVCDGAMGTMLYAKGIFLNRSFDELNLTQPDLVAEVHQAYVRAGADVLETNTFGANRIKLGAFGLADRVHAINPLITCYQSGDGRWFWLLLLQADRHWPDLCRALGREDLMQDERFANITVRREHAPELVAELDAVFATKTLEEWGEVLDRENVWWAPVNTITEALQDPLVRASGALTSVEGPDGVVPVVNTPVDFYGTPNAPRGVAPELGQHTEELLLELGHDWDAIIALKESGAIP